MTGTHGNVEMFATDQPTAPNVLFRSKFRELTSLMSQKTLWFSWLPLALICAAIASSLYWAQGTTPKSIEVIPWLIALFFGRPFGIFESPLVHLLPFFIERLDAPSPRRHALSLTEDRV